MLRNVIRRPCLICPRHIRGPLDPIYGHSTDAGIAIAFWADRGLRGSHKRAANRALSSISML